MRGRDVPRFKTTKAPTCYLGALFFLFSFIHDMKQAAFIHRHVSQRAGQKRNANIRFFIGLYK